MINLIEKNLKLAELTDDKNQKVELLTTSYIMILGYLSAQNDKFFYNNNDDIKLKKLEDKIKNILNTKYNLISNKNSTESFKIFINNFKTEDNTILCNQLTDYFYKGYNYYMNFYETHNTFIDFVLGTHRKLEMKLKDFI